jgi:hypothetical protein
VREDHDVGLAVGSEQSDDRRVHRAAIGLPIIQHFSHPPRREVQWHETYDEAKARRSHEYHGEGRFAAPGLLRPHRDAQGKWHALVIFVDAHKWPNSKPVYLNGQQRRVSLDLYEAMKNDEALRPFP